MRRQFEFMQQNNFTLPFCTEFSLGSRSNIENSIRPFSIGFGSFFLQMVLENSNLSLCRKIFEHCHFVQNFPPVPEMISKIQSDPLPLVYGIIFKNYLADFLKIYLLFLCVSSLRKFITNTSCFKNLPTTIAGTVDRVDIAL